MTDPVTIRRGVPECLRAQATALYCEALQAKLTPFLGPVERAARFLAPAMRADRAFVAIDEAGILGIAGFQEDRTGLFDFGLASLWREYGLSGPVRAIGLATLHRREVRDTLLMDGITVAAAARGRGIGTRLLAAVCDHARDLGKTGVRLDVVDTNPRAEALYERQDFNAIEQTGTGPFRAIFPFRTVTTMRKTVCLENGRFLDTPLRRRGALRIYQEAILNGHGNREAYATRSARKVPKIPADQGGTGRSGPDRHNAR